MKSNHPKTIQELYDALEEFIKQGHGDARVEIHRNYSDSAFSKIWINDEDINAEGNNVLYLEEDD